MPLIKVTKTDLAKIQNLEAGWYGAKIVKVEAPSAAADGKSVNYPVVFQINHSSEKEITVNYNSKLIAMANGPYKAIFGKDIDGEFDLDQLVGKELDVKIKQAPYNGVMYDNIEAYLPKGKGREQVTPF